MVLFVSWYGAFRKPKEPISQNHCFFATFWWRKNRCGKGFFTHHDGVAFGLHFSILRKIFVKIFYRQERINIQFRGEKAFIGTMFCDGHKDYEHICLRIRLNTLVALSAYYPRCAPAQTTKIHFRLLLWVHFHIFVKYKMWFGSDKYGKTSFLLFVIALAFHYPL